MGIDFFEVLLLVSGGSLVSSLFALVHFVSTYNRYNRSFTILSPIIIGTVAIYAATISTGYGPVTSTEEAIVTAIVSILNLLPIVLAITTIVLFRISLLTNRSVDASS